MLGLMPAARRGADRLALAPELADAIAQGVRQRIRHVRDAHAAPEAQAFVDALLLGHGLLVDHFRHSPRYEHHLPRGSVSERGEHSPFGKSLRRSGSVPNSA